MSVGSIGAVDLGIGLSLGAGVGLAAPASVVSSMGGLNGPLGQFEVTSLAAATNGRIGQLLQLVQGFTSAEILLALIMAGTTGGSRCHRRHNDSFAFLAGLALTAKLGTHLSNLDEALRGSAAKLAYSPAPTGSTGGGSLNVTA